MIQCIPKMIQTNTMVFNQEEEELWITRQHERENVVRKVPDLLALIDNSKIIRKQILK